MKPIIRTLALFPISLTVLIAFSFAQKCRAQAVTEIGGQKVVTITRTVSGTTRPEFTSVTVLPGRGMEVLQITANFPGKGNVDVLASPDLASAAKILDQEDNEIGGRAYTMGAAFLVPYPNRIRGKLSAGGNTITTEWEGHTFTLPANSRGRNPGAERHAMHGLILKAKTDEVRVTDILGGQQVAGVVHAGDFGGHWLSNTDLDFNIALTAEAVDVSIVARNVGHEAEPIAIGWHPYFNLPSGDRTQARVRVPASTVAQVNNYDSVFPTGKILPVEGTMFDLRAPAGKPLGNVSFDDNWSHLEWKGCAVTVQVIDPAACYGVSIDGLSPEIKTIQLYAPQAKEFVAVEDQYNFGDPFGKEWGTTDTGMVTLKPGESTKWHVRLHVYVP